MRHARTLPNEPDRPVLRRPRTAEATIGGTGCDGSHPAVAVLGDPVRWTNDDSISHSTVSDSWSSGSIGSGATFAFDVTAAGTYAYHRGVHPSTMRGAVRVPVRVSPTAGYVGSEFVMRIATRRAPRNASYDLQTLVDGGRWMLLKRDTRRPVAHLFPDRAAGYEFRARYDDGSAVTKWSPLVGITVG